MIQELELEAKERQIRLAGTRPNAKLKPDLPQKSAEGHNYDDSEPYRPERHLTDSAPAPAKATTHTAKTEPADKKNDG